jgi:Kef-type K+ transport system membrane component KefB
MLLAISLSHEALAHLLLKLAVIMISGRLMGEFMRKWNQPAVVGELLAGIILGPTLLGSLLNDEFKKVFVQDDVLDLSMDVLTKISVILLLFIAGLEVEMHVIFKHRKHAMITSLGGIILPFSIGFGVPYVFPDLFGDVGSNKLLFSLFLGTALSISALPVIARTLMDLKIFKTPLGMLIISSAMVDDFLGWMIFSVILSMMGKDVSVFKVVLSSLATLVFAVFILTIGKRILNFFLAKIKSNFSWPGGIMSFIIAMGFLSASLTETLGIHAIFGAFLMGIAISDSVHVQEKVKEVIYLFVTNIFAPLFFVNIGLKVDFLTNFNLPLTVLLLVLAFMGKLIGCSISTRISGFTWRESLAVGFGMNARGAMEIILASLALQAGLIHENLFVSLVIMALVTSMIGGPAMKWLLKLSPAKDTVQNESAAVLSS